MVYFQTKNPNSGKFLKALNGKVLVNFMEILNILWIFGLFYGYLGYFLDIWVIFWIFGLFFGYLGYFMDIWIIL
jgi:hypothetical protein